MSPSPRGSPAPRPWPLLVFALVALAASVASAVVRLRQPLDSPSVTPLASALPLPSPGSRAAPPPPTLRAPPPRTPGAPARIVLPVAPAAPMPSATTASVGPLSTVSAPAATPSAAPAGLERAGPAAVTSVSPPVLRRGATALVDVHGVGLRRDHQVRIGRGREAARGVEMVRQRYVGPALLQVLLRVDASAAPGGYVLSLVDGAGSTTNPRPIQIVK